MRLGSRGPSETLRLSNSKFPTVVILDNLVFERGEQLVLGCCDMSGRGKTCRFGSNTMINQAKAEPRSSKSYA